MLHLYYKPSCPYCQKVLSEVEGLGLKLNLKDISTDPVARDELLERGGKQQVPFLVDEEAGVSMYESSDIVEYLKNNHTKTGEVGTNGLRVHKSDDACDVCQ